MINLLKRKAEEERVAMSAIIRKILGEKMDEERGNAAKSLLELARRAPKNKIGVSDLSKRHDYYLYIEPYERKQKRKR